MKWLLESPEIREVPEVTWRTFCSPPRASTNWKAGSRNWNHWSKAGANPTASIDDDDHCTQTARLD